MLFTDIDATLIRFQICHADIFIYAPMLDAAAIFFRYADASPPPLIDFHFFAMPLPPHAIFFRHAISVAITPPPPLLR
jgi:hypothetical protein